MPIRILLADDVAAIRSAVRRMLEIDPDIIVVGEVSDLSTLQRTVKEVNPDIVVLDLHLGPNVNDIIQQLKVKNPKVRIVVVTAFAQRTHGTMGVDGFLDKMNLATHLLPLVKSLGKQV
jgi:DNA-binding NarL/FixJ family response regulator